MVEADRGEEDLEFEWGIKKGVGGKKKDFQFYQSFTYDGVEYELYDSVYLWVDGEPEPHIGKLVKIMENPDKKKIVKVLWFFRPCEVLKYPGVVVDAAEDELFLASGEGAGLANMNPLEAIAGKCKVVCTSKNSRNPQPSDEELQKADFIFYRAFDVKDLKILDKIEEKVAGIEVKCLFNRPGLQKPSIVLNLDSDKKGVGGNAVASNETEVSSKRNPSKEHTTLLTNGISVDTLWKEHADSNASLVKQRASLRENPASSVGVEAGEMPLSNVEMENISTEQTKSRSKVTKNTGSKAFLDKQKSSLREHPASSIVVESGGSKTNNRQDPSDKSASRPEDDSVKREGKVGNIPVRQGTVGKLSIERTGMNLFVAPGKSEKKVKSAKDCGDLEDRPAKKAKFDSSIKASDDKNEKNVLKLSVGLDGNDPKTLATKIASENKPRLKLTEDLQGAGKSPFKVPDEKTKHSNGKLLKASPIQSPDVDKKMVHQIMEVTRRPDADRSKWFRGLPWEERMKTANEQGTLVLLQNLDPLYTSAEVEDIVWHGFKESCTAKMIQRTCISSPHCGQAFVIFKTREAAETVVRRLDEGCLLLSNGRPLVGSIGTPCFPEKKPTFFGHYVIDKVRHQMARGMREAVSTSHCSQSNTIEYEMAMEWCLLQERSELSWKKLYKRQGEELKKLNCSFKSKWR